MSTHQVATWAEWAGWKQELPSRLPRAACLNDRQLRPTIDDNRGDWEHQGGKLEQHPPKWRSATSWPQRRQKPNQLTNEQQLKLHFPPTKYSLQGLFSASNLKLELDSKDSSQTEFIARVYIMCVWVIVCFHVFIFLLKVEATFSTFHQLDLTSPTPVFDAKSFQENFNLVRIPGWAETGIVGRRRAQVTSPELPLNLF